MASNGNGVCCICSKTVYATELMVVDEREYHKGCFRCCVCKRPITITSYTSYNGEIYCKAHKPTIDSKNTEQLRLHDAPLKHSRNQTAPPLLFNKNLNKVHDGGDIKSPMSENMCSLKNIFEKNDSSYSAPTTPRSPSFSSPTTCERIEILKKEIQQSNGNASEISYKKNGTLRLKNKNTNDDHNDKERMEKVNKMLNEIDENWNEFEKSNNEYISKNDEEGKFRAKPKALSREELDQIKRDETFFEEYNKYEKEMEEIIRNIDTHINNYFERKNNEASSTESSIESFLEEYSIDSSIKPLGKEINIIGGINNIFKKNSEKLNSSNFGNGTNSFNNGQSKSNVLWIRSSNGYKYDKLSFFAGSKKSNNHHHKNYTTSSTLQDYLNIAFETKIEDTRSLEEICKSIEQYNSELKHGCESSKAPNNNRPLIESIASPLKFLIETLNTFYMKIRGIIATGKLKKIINIMVTLEDILIKEGFQHNIEFQTQTEWCDLIISACNAMNTYSSNILKKYNILRRKMNVYPRDTFREELISNYDDVAYSYTDCVLDRINTDAKVYRNSFIDQEHRNYVGNQSCVGGPFIISIKKLKKSQSADAKAEDAAYQAIVRIKDVPEIIILIPSVTVRSQAKLRSSTSWKAVLQAIHPEINVNSVCKIKEKDKVFQKKLIDLDEFQCVSKFKFGVLYAKAGQTSEEEMFNNENGSPAFDEFLSILGETVELKNYTGYAAGLDVQYGNTGKTTVVTKWRDYEVTYHVSTMLPYDKDDHQQIQRKRHIGNDIVCFIFLDGRAKFDPATIVSQFLHIFIVVQPLQPEESLGIGYRVTVVSKTDVPVFGPPLPHSGIFHNISSLRDFLLAKSINGENSAYLAPKFYKPQLRTRGALIEDLVKDYYEINSTINSSLSLNNMSSLGVPSTIAQSPTTGTIRSLDDGSMKKGNYSSAAITPTVTIVEEDSNTNNNNSTNEPLLSIKKVRSANNLNLSDNIPPENSETKLNRFDSCDSISMKDPKFMHVSQSSVSSDYGTDKKKSISSIFTSIGNLGKSKPHTGAVPLNPQK